MNMQNPFGPAFVWQTNFLSSLSVTSFLKTLTTIILKNFSKILNYTLQNIKKKHTSNFFLKTFTVSYSIVLDKHPKNLLAKRDCSFGEFSLRNIQ